MICIDKREMKLRLLDAFTVYGISLIIAALVGVLLYRLIGIWAMYLSCVLVLVTVFVISAKTRLKIGNLLKFNMPRAGEFIGSSMIYAGALLIAFPILLLVQIIVPNFAVTCFHITDAVEGQILKYLHIILLIIITGVSEAILFEGYMYTRLRPYDNIVKTGAIVALSYAFFQLDLYTLFPLILVEFAIVYVRSRSGGMTLPTALHLLTATIAFAVRDLVRDVSQLPGTRMGALEVIGMAMIFAGAALPVTIVGMRLLGDFKNKPLLHKAIILLVSVVLIASGYGISRA